jgi:hypothetical protein
MDAKSIKERATAQGFDTSRIWYRGVSGNHDLRGYSMWTDKSEEAMGYAMGGALTNKGENPIVLESYQKNGKGRDIDSEIQEAIMNDEDPDEIAKRILDEEGLDWVEFSHPAFLSDEYQLVRVVKNPSDIGLTYSDFDPANDIFDRAHRENWNSTDLQRALVNKAYMTPEMAKRQTAYF